MSFIKESYLAYKKVQEVLEKETSDHEIAMARSELEGIADKATATSSMLEGMTESGNPLPAWVQSKITNASDYITSVHDYLKYNPQINESVSLEETTFEKIYQMQQDGKSVEDIAKELNLKADLVKKVLGESKTISEGLSDAQIAQLKKEYEPLKGKTITTAQYQQLKNILFKLQDGDLEKLQKQNIPFASTGAGSILRVRKAPVKITNVTVPGLEGMAEGVDMSKVTKYKMISIKGDQKIITIDRSDLEKYLKLGYVIHEPLTEEIVVDKPAILKSLQDRLKKLESDPDHGGKQDMIAYVKSKIKMLQSKKEEAELKPVPSLEDSAKKHKVDIEVLKKQLEKGIKVEKEHTKDEKTAEKIALAHIDERPDYYDQLAKVEKQPVKESHFAIGQHVIYHGPKNPITPIKAQIIGMASPQKGAYYLIKKTDGETTYAAPEQMKLQEATFDVRLDVDGGVDTRSADSVAKMLKDKGIMAKVEPSERDSKAVTIDTSASKDKVVNVLGNIVDEACWTGYKQVGMKKKNGKEVPNCVPEETLREQKRLYIESIAAVKNKAEKSGMPYSILKQVYDRGMAAWKGGHRPGATQVQWALARVNSFVTKSSGTWGGADSDLAKKVKGD